MSLIKIQIALLCALLFCAAGCRSFQNAVNDDESTVKARKAAAAKEEQPSGIAAELNEDERTFVDDFHRQGEIDRKKSRKRVFGF